MKTVEPPVMPSARAQGRAMPFIAEPPRINPLLRAGIWFVERQLGQPFVPGRLVAWSPRTALRWLLVPGGKRLKSLGDRILPLVAISAAYSAGSPFCVAANVAYAPGADVTDAELEAIRAGADASEVPTFTRREALAIKYARLISSTPLEFPEEFVRELTAAFSEREIVVLAAEAAAINYNARLIESLGAPAPDLRARSKRVRSSRRALS